MFVIWSRRLKVVLLLCGLLAGCSSLRPWQNQPLQSRGPAQAPWGKDDESIAMLVTISGGGARAAAFGYGVLDALHKTRVHWKGRDFALLDEVDVISGVSGGSIIAAYYAAFGEQTFPGFEQDFLRQNFQDSLISSVLSVGRLHDLSSPWFGRSHLLAQRLDKLYQGKAFGDLANHPGLPRLLISATDLSLGSSFEFTYGQFALICSDLDSVPLSFAVTASSAVPIALSPMSLRNYSDACPFPARESGARTQDDYRVRLLRESQHSYLDASQRPYIHLVDGGLADNLGLRSLLDRTLADGGIRKSTQRISRSPISQLVIIAINAERDPTERIDASAQVPGTSQVIDALLFGSGARATQETLGLLSDTAQNWRRELGRAASDGKDPFAPDAQIHVINVNLRDAPELLGRSTLLQVPTAFSIPSWDVTRLIEAGGHILRQSPQFKALLRSLGGPVSGP